MKNGALNKDTVLVTLFRPPVAGRRTAGLYLRSMAATFEWLLPYMK
jgi:hypothetical protein